MAGRARIDRKRRPIAGPAPKIRLPEFQRFRLDNGMAVLAIHHDDLPHISARLLLPYKDEIRSAEGAGRPISFRGRFGRSLSNGADTCATPSP